mmetsp:Transcript_15800/g.36457  ORF Transcript_15800/g.36457 Transcript_15800/m.36457 type:complete len:222 (-) Transcript_15800:318-983(-)
MSRNKTTSMASSINRALVPMVMVAAASVLFVSHPDALSCCKRMHEVRDRLRACRDQNRELPEVVEAGVIASLRKLEELESRMRDKPSCSRAIPRGLQPERSVPRPPSLDPDNFVPLQARHMLTLGSCNVAFASECSKEAQEASEELDRCQKQSRRVEQLRDFESGLKHSTSILQAEAQRVGTAHRCKSKPLVRPTLTSSVALTCRVCVSSAVSQSGTGLGL